MPEGDTIQRVADRLRPALVGRPSCVRFEAPRLAGGPAPAGRSGGGGRGRRQAPAGPLRARRHRADPPPHDRLVAPVPPRRALAEAGPPRPGRHRRGRLGGGVLRRPGGRAASSPGAATPLAHLGPDLSSDGPTSRWRVARMAALADADDADRRRSCWTSGSPPASATSTRARSCGRARVSPLARVAAVDEAKRRELLGRRASRFLRANLGPGQRVTAPGVPGGLAVYGRRGRPCPRCATPIVRRVLGRTVRSTYWCPRCQPAPAGAGGPPSGGSGPTVHRVDRGQPRRARFRGMEHIRLGRTGLPVSRALPRHDDLRRPVRRGRVRRHPRPQPPRPASPSSTPPTSTPSAAAWRHGRAGPRRSSAGGCRAAATTSSSPPSASGAMAARRWDRGASRKHILDAVDASLRRLQTDYIDLYQLHSSDPDTPIEETLRALDDLVRQGKVRYVGCSNFLAWQVARAIGPQRGARRSSASTRCSPATTCCSAQIERELLPLCRDEGIGVIPYNPLAGGFLTGKHRRAPPTEGTRFTLGGGAGERYRERYWHEQMFATVDRAAGPCRRGRDVAGPARRGVVLAQPAITSPIVGASRPEQLDDAVAAVDDAARARALRPHRRPDPGLPGLRRRTLTRSAEAGGSGVSVVTRRGCAWGGRGGSPRRSTPVASRCGSSTSGRPGRAAHARNRPTSSRSPTSHAPCGKPAVRVLRRGSSGPAARVGDATPRPERATRSGAAWARPPAYDRAMTVTFVDPRAEPSLPIEPYELGIDVTEGPVAIGLLANGFPDSVAFLDQVEARWPRRCPAPTSTATTRASLLAVSPTRCSTRSWPTARRWSPPTAIEAAAPPAPCVTA